MGRLHRPSFGLGVLTILVALVAMGQVNVPTVPLPIAKGGTNGITATAAFDNLSPLTTRGDLIYRNATGNTRLAAGTAGQILQTNGSSADPAWVPLSFGTAFSAGDGGASPGFTMAAGASVYVGTLYGVDPSSAETIGGVAFGWKVPFSGTINRVTLEQVVLGTPGTAGQNITYVLRKNATTSSSTVASIDANSANQFVTVTTLGFSVTAGDTVAMRMTAPSPWTTPATVMFVGAYLILETP